MAAVLVEGKRYGLTSLPGTSSISGFGNKTVYHVKFTDAFARAIEEFRTSKVKNNKHKITIQFYDNQGLLVIPGTKQSQEFRFGTADIKSDDTLSSVECIEHISNGRQDALAVIGEFSKKLTVMANDEVYKSTKEKFTLVEQEIKKSGAKEIAMDDPNKGRRIKLPAVRPSSLLKNASKSSSSVSNQPRTLSSPVEFAPVKQSPTIPSQTSAFSLQPTAPSPVAGKTATTGVVSSLPSGSAGASSLKPLTSSATVINYPYRDRIIHLLALRPYKKIELDQVLRRDGVREKDKNTLTAILTQVATNKNNSYILLRHIFNTEVRLNWPFYTEENRQYLKRTMESHQELVSGNVGSTFSSPAVSPCLSNSSSHGSPVSSTTHSNKQGNKRPALLDDDVKYHEPPKKQRIAHSQTKSSIDQTFEQEPSREYSTSRVVAVSNQNTRIKADKKSLISTNTPVESRENIVRNTSPEFHMDDFKKTYVQIVSHEQRQRYKQDFNSEYNEYRALYSEMSNRMQVFKRLKDQLSKESGETKEEVKEQIISEYRILQADSKYLVRRNRCDYLHSKLAYIKCLVDCYDKARFTTDKTTLQC